MSPLDCEMKIKDAFRDLHGTVSEMNKCAERMRRLTVLNPEWTKCADWMEAAAWLLQQHA